MRLGVNIDHVATLRQARGGKEPDTVWAARVCEKAGAHSIVMHLREDRRHIQDADLFRVKQTVSIKLNLEMSIAPGVARVAARLLPEQATLVPERRMERTTEGGLDLFKKETRLGRCVEGLKKKGILVSLFIDPDPRNVRAVRGLGADAIEFHTGDYANQKSTAGIQREFKRLQRAAERAREMGLTAHAGHGLDYRNVTRLKEIPWIEELNIGFSIVTRALAVGLEPAVKEMLQLIA